MIGAGVIVIELVSVYRRMGTKVIVIEYANTACSTLDQDFSKEFLKALKKNGIKFLF